MTAVSVTPASVEAINDTTVDVVVTGVDRMAKVTVAVDGGVTDFVLRPLRDGIARTGVVVSSLSKIGTHRIDVYDWNRRRDDDTTNDAPIASTTFEVTAPAPPVVEPVGDDVVVRTVADMRQAMVTASPGRRVLVRGGTYTWPYASWTPAPGTVAGYNRVEPYPGEVVVIRGMQQLVDPAYWVIRGIRFEWDPAVTSGDGNANHLRIIAGTGWLLEDCEITGNPFAAGLLVGYSTSLRKAPTDWTVRGNFIHDTQESAVYCNPSRQARNGLIEGNVIARVRGSSSSGIKLGWGGTSVDRVDMGIAGVTARYNTVVDAATPLTIAEPSAGGIEVYRNLLVKAGGRHAVRLDSVEGHLAGPIRVADNAGWGVPVFMDDLGGKGPVREADADGGGNVLVDPRFNHTDDVLTGFRPQSAVAAAYGAFAR